MEGLAAARAARAEMPAGDYQVTYTFHPPSKTRRDLDNFIARMKKVQDGIFAAWCLDDSCIRRVVGEWGEVTRPGRVTVTIERM
jgi:Holliday junction resolvase RusA-like endonuclease